MPNPSILTIYDRDWTIRQHLDPLAASLQLSRSETLRQIMAYLYANTQQTHLTHWIHNNIANAKHSIRHYTKHHAKEVKT